MTTMKKPVKRKILSSDLVVGVTLFLLGLGPVAFLSLGVYAGHGPLWLSVAIGLVGIALSFLVALNVANALRGVQRGCLLILLAIDALVAYVLFVVWGVGFW